MQLIESGGCVHISRDEIISFARFALSDLRNNVLEDVSLGLALLCPTCEIPRCPRQRGDPGLQGTRTPRLGPGLWTPRGSFVPLEQTLLDIIPIEKSLCCSWCGLVDSADRATIR